MTMMIFVDDTDESRSNKTRRRLTCMIVNVNGRLEKGRQRGRVYLPYYKVGIGTYY